MMNKVTNVKNSSWNHNFRFGPGSKLLCSHSCTIKTVTDNHLVHVHGHNNNIIMAKVIPAAKKKEQKKQKKKTKKLLLLHYTNKYKINKEHVDALI